MIGSQANIDDNLRYTARLNTGRGGSRNPSRVNSTLDFLQNIQRYKRLSNIYYNIF